ncbi:MAG: DNA gyrase C-terminal beta-propeller domain-containing protein, partial [Acidimicrobiia bacterium]|nr:DNA gyrase C-terminal beta-propeller domain-containing protein [Acidimicrobiia bacterium]
AVRKTTGENDIMLFTNDGMGIRFSEDDTRPMGRDTMGVRGVRLRDDDFVVAMAVDEEGEEVLLLTSGGYGKRTAIDQFPRQKRGGVGVKAIKLTRVRGTLVGARAVAPGSEIFAISSNGIVIRTAVDSISRQGRNATGVKVMSPGEGGEVTAFAPIPVDEE